jgi:hypothetical protein
MISKLFGLLTAFFIFSASAYADPVVIPVPVPVPGHDDCYGSGCKEPAPHYNYCKDYNRDGITCDQVGFDEGQVGYPWGYKSGKFRCENGCLAWVGQAESCKAYNRDGVTCDQVGYHEGQIGYPWGLKSGKFRCTSGCLQFLWWW